MLMVRQFFLGLLDIFLPPICHICHSFIPDSGKLHICPECFAGLSHISSSLCPLCGIPFIGAGDNHICGDCLRNRPNFDSAHATFLYKGEIRNLIHSFKYNQKTHLRYPLALMILDDISKLMLDQQPDLIVPVPLHRSRLRQRGFNQAVLLGQILSQKLAVPILYDSLIRIRRTEPQIELSGNERRVNVRGAFAVKRGDLVAGKRIMLLDDVMTTGSTMNECANELKKAGALTVWAVTVARTVK